MTIAALLLAGSLSLLAAPRAATPTPQETEEYSVFVEASGDLTKSEQIAMWEVFLQKFPRSPYAGNARAKIAELKGERPALTPTPAPVVEKPARAAAKAPPADYDPDLAFLYEDAPAATPAKPAKAAPAPTPAPEVLAEPTPTPAHVIAKPRPVATPEPSFFAPEPTPAPAPRRTQVASAASVWDAPSEEPASSSSSMWDEPVSERKAKKAKKEKSKAESFSMDSPRRSSAPRSREPRRASEWLDTEVAAFHTLSLVEDPYIHNSLTGLEVSRRFGSRLSLEVEGAAAQSAETPALKSLRAQGRQPRVITKSNFAVGGGVQFGVLAPGGRNDLFVLGGGGIVNSNVEACKKDDAACETPLFFKGVNFSYAMAGAGHRFYVTSRIALHTEFRGRFVFEKVDGETTPRSAFQVNVGPSFSF